MKLGSKGQERFPLGEHLWNRYEIPLVASLKKTFYNINLEVHFLLLLAVFLISEFSIFFSSLVHIVPTRLLLVEAIK